MNAQKVEDVKDTALKLDEIRVHRPEDYFYLKGWIHCLLQKEEKKQATAKSFNTDGTIMKKEKFSNLMEGEIN